MRKLSFVVVLAAGLLATRAASAFCGFYVAGADAKLFADASQVVLMRDGTRTVVSMQNDYKGPRENFAMIVPVPVVLQKEQVKILPREVFEKVDTLGAPRLVEYWERDPCSTGNTWGDGIGLGNIGTLGFGGGGGGAGVADLGVKVEAKFTVGEYEIVILSAKDSTGLETWLKEQKYAIPSGAEPYLRPYVQSGSKFFVARVDSSKIKIDDGHATLSPLRFYYDASEFTLPVRLGLVNSSGVQDLIVNILARGQRYEVANYPSAVIPTNLDVAESTRGRFAEFYAALFDQVLEKNPKAVVTEYAWDAGACDPCPGPTLDGNDVATLGADVTPSGLSGLSLPSSRVTQGNSGRSTTGVTMRQGPIQVNGRLPPEVIQRIVRQNFGRFRLCYENGLKANPNLQGRVSVKFVIARTGEVATAADSGSDLPDQATVACVVRGFKNLTFPEPEGGIVTVTFPLVFNASPTSSSDAAAPPPPPPRFFSGGGAGNFVLTRLHVRYGKDGLGQDLVFKAVPPIMGGREMMNDGALEKGARPADANNFQGRYVIRHAWTGPIACKDPQRNIWGGPPTDEAGSNVPPPPLAAQKTAFAPRGQTPVSAFLATGAVADIAPATPPTVTLDAGDAPSSSRRGCAGCAVVEESVGLTDRWAPLAGVALALTALLRRARRR
jgi:hypothetical protein